jgi:hypothetical protein
MPVRLRPAPGDPGKRGCRRPVARSCAARSSGLGDFSGPRRVALQADPVLRRLIQAATLLTEVSLRR